MNPNEIDNALERIIQQYSVSFAAKLFIEESLEEDDLMRVFGLNQEIKAENKQYWGRELGKCWERIVIALCRQRCDNFSAAIREGQDELCDLVIGLDAIDTKYRIGSGDSGTLKKFRQYAVRLRQMGYNPVLLILRSDSLSQAINACRMGGWTIRAGTETYEYLRSSTGFDLESWLKVRRDRYNIRP
ncbi:restriction endonuclease [Microcoleus sp. FACHB-831]|uniref:restriction endonuclease n=1 Tax=Microcoleus sp. FACHB-831 TaxID=2692827 RepID=UPI0016865F94|nr:restriction endonuclease [Microcoleus sp. FACHB-831]MBD1924177.1 restriction endonuclease [Microcoleus sp. FACHB-831]